MQGPIWAWYHLSVKKPLIEMGELKSASTKRSMSAVVVCHTLRTCGAAVSRGHPCEPAGLGISGNTLGHLTEPPAPVPGQGC